MADRLASHENIVGPDSHSTLAQFSLDAPGDPCVFFVERKNLDAISEYCETLGVALSLPAASNAVPKLEQSDAGNDYLTASIPDFDNPLANSRRATIERRDAGVGVEKKAQSKSKSRSGIGGGCSRSGKGGASMASIAANTAFMSTDMGSRSTPVPKRRKRTTFPEKRNSLGRRTA